MCHHAKFLKIGQTVVEILFFFRFSRWLPSAMLDFKILKLLVAHHVGSAIAAKPPMC